MTEHEVINAIQLADQAINQRDIVAIMDFYADDATLVIEPGQCAYGKEQIAKAWGCFGHMQANAIRGRHGGGIQSVDGNEASLHFQKVRKRKVEVPN